jgi:hypothetical protein
MNWLQKNQEKGNTWLAAKDYRTWVLTIAYAAVWRVEITVDNFAVYFHDDYVTLIFAGLPPAFLMDKHFCKSIRWYYISIRLADDMDLMEKFHYWLFSLLA